MAKAKPKAEVKTSGQNVAQLAGTLSGTADHIARLSQELTDISGRCVLALEFSATTPVVTEDDKKFLNELKDYCDKRFGNLHDMRRKIEGILDHVNGVVR